MLLTNDAVSNHTDLTGWESAPKQWAAMAIVEDRSPTFETVLRGLIGCIYFLSVGWKQSPILNGFFDTDLHLVSLNLEPTRPNGLLGCKVPTDLVKISVKETTHMGFHLHTQHPTPFESHLRWLTQIWLFKEFSWNIIGMEILIYRRQRIDYAEQDDVTCYVAGPLEICPQRISKEWSRAASPGAVLQRAMSPYMVALGPDEVR